MQIYALYGKSGTGKSYRAVRIAHKYHIPTLIDDGLIIHRGKKIFGSKSAKGEKNRISAIRMAIFDDEEYAAKMKKSIANINTDKILILGTSQGMIYKIIENLGLPQPDVWIDVRELTSSEERRIAKSHRLKGKHVVPLAPTEILNGGIKVPLLGRLKFFLKGEEFPSKNAAYGKQRVLKEQAIVRANYQALGSIYINKNVLYDMVRYMLKQDSRVNNIKEIRVHPPMSSPVIEAKVALTFDWETSLQEMGSQISNEITELVKSLTGIDEIKIVIVISEIAVSNIK